MKLTLSAAAVLLVALLALAWHDVVPGGWTLRGVVQGHAAREAWLRERSARARHERFARENPDVPAGRVVFLGSSTIERFPLDACFPGRPALNRGVNGETVLDLLEHLERTVPAAAPAGFVLGIGGNDLRREGVAPAELAARYGRLLERLAARWPGVPVAVLGLYPVADTDAPRRARLEAANAALAAAAAAHGAAFVPTDRPELCSPGGRLAEEVRSDPDHLAAPGYRLVAAWLLAEGGAAVRPLVP